MIGRRVLAAPRLDRSYLAISLVAWLLVAYGVTYGGVLLRAGLPLIGLGTAALVVSRNPWPPLARLGVTAAAAAGSIAAALGIYLQTLAITAYSSGDFLLMVTSASTLSVAVLGAEALRRRWVCRARAAAVAASAMPHQLEELAACGPLALGALEALLAAGRWQDAQIVATRMVLPHAYENRRRTCLGSALLELGHVDAAIAVMTEVRDVSVEDAVADHRLARVLIRLAIGGGDAAHARWWMARTQLAPDELALLEADLAAAAHDDQRTRDHLARYRALAGDHALVELAASTRPSACYAHDADDVPYR